jgi:pyrimidine deaminase RibD-like protein
MTITEFLTARLDEDEAAARDVLENGLVSWDEARQILYRAGWHAERAEAHIARHDPARVLADVAAKRAIVALHPCDDCGMGNDPCSTLRLLAQPYAEHPDYDEEWRP